MPSSGWLTTPYLGLGPSWDCSKREIDDVKSLLAVSDKLVAGDSPGYVSEEWGDTRWTDCDWVLDWRVVPPLWALEPSFPILCNKWLPATPNIQRVSNLLRKHLGVHLPRELVESCFALLGEELHWTPTAEKCWRPWHCKLWKSAQPISPRLS